MSGPEKQLDRTKLAKLLGMLGSAHDGEIAAAGRKANALVKAAGITWEEAIKPVVDVQVVTVEVESSPDPRTLAREIFESGFPLETRENAFVRDMLRQVSRFTPSQIRWLKIIAVKAGVL